MLGLIWGSLRLILGVRCAVLNETDQEVIVTDFDKVKGKTIIIIFII